MRCRVRLWCWGGHGGTEHEILSCLVVVVVATGLWLMGKCGMMWIMRTLVDIMIAPAVRVPMAPNGWLHVFLDALTNRRACLPLRIYGRRVVRRITRLRL